MADMNHNVRRGEHDLYQQSRKDGVFTRGGNRGCRLDHKGRAALAAPLLQTQCPRADLEGHQLERDQGGSRTTRAALQGARVGVSNQQGDDYYSPSQARPLFNFTSMSKLIGVTGPVRVLKSYGCVKVLWWVRE